MRTTGLRRAPVPAPRNSWIENSTPETTPRNSLILENEEGLSYDEEHTGVTLRVISQSIPPREGLTKELLKVRLGSESDLNTSTNLRTPPPKPPRTYIYIQTPDKEDSLTCDHDGNDKPIKPTTLSELKKLSPESPSSSETSDLSTFVTKPLIRSVISTPDISDELGAYNYFSSLTRSSVRSSRKFSLNRPLSSDSPVATFFADPKMAFRSFRRRPQDIPPVPSRPPPATPSQPTAQASSRYTPLPTNTTLRNNQASRPTRNGRTPESNTTRSPNTTHPRPATPAQRTPGSSGGGSSGSGGSTSSVASSQDSGRANKMIDQAPISTPGEFEITCVKTLKITRNAKTLMDRNQYNQAAAQYQLALGYIDRILKTKVLELTTHESTRQKFFQMQEAIFTTRKECLNGFSDAQAAVAAPQCLGTTNPPPGAPPSYQDVLREDRRRTGQPPPLPVRPANLSRPPQSSQQVQAQPLSRYPAQVHLQPQSFSHSEPRTSLRTPPRTQPNSQIPAQVNSPTGSQALPKLPRRLSQTQVVPRTETSADSHTPPIIPRRQPRSVVAPQAASSVKPQTPPKPSQMQPLSESSSQSKYLTNQESVPQQPTGIQSHSEGEQQVHSKVTPQKPPRRLSQSKSQTSPQAHSHHATSEGHETETEACLQLPSQPEAKSMTSNKQIQLQLDDLSSELHTLVPPKPLPRSCPPPQPQLRSQPQPQSQDHTKTESKSPSKTTEYIYDHPKTSHQQTDCHSSQSQSFNSAHNLKVSLESPKDQNQCHRPAYLRTSNQPIGDLLRQALFGKREGVSVQSATSSSVVSEVDNDKDDKSSLEPTDISQKSISDLMRFKPFSSTKISMPVSSSKFYSHEPINNPSRHSPVLAGSSKQDVAKVEEGKSDVGTHSIEAHKQISGVQPLSPETSSRITPLDSRDTRGIQEIPVPLPRGQKTLKQGNRPSTLNMIAQVSQDSKENIYSLPSKTVVDTSQRVSHTAAEKVFKMDVKSASIVDPFTTIDPFPPLIPSSMVTDIPLSVDFSADSPTSYSSSSAMCESDSPTANANSLERDNPLSTPLKPVHAPDVLLQPVVVGAAANKLKDKEVRPVKQKNANDSTCKNLGDSILDALDFAGTPKHQRVSVQRSKELMHVRRHSQESLLDFSFNTLNMYLQSSDATNNKKTNICASRASIIEEFDPLISLSPTSENVDSDEVDVMIPHEENGSIDTITADVEGNIADVHAAAEDPTATDYHYAVPRKLKWESADNLDGTVTDCLPPEKEEEEKDSSIADFPKDSYENTSTVPVVDKDVTYDYPASPQHIYAELGTRSSFTSSIASSESWSSQMNKSSPTPPLPTPLTASSSDQNSWKSWNFSKEESDEEQAVGRSAFYRATSSDQNSFDEPSSYPPSDGAQSLPPSVTGTYRELIKIREGVKIFFIHEDGVITSPWNKPFLSVSKDSTKSWHGQSLLLRVGKSLWSCELVAKSTLVFKTESGTYIFRETNNKPECAAVALKIPSSVRKTQHELLAKIMHENTRLEVERPSGLTKGISKSAASAATRVEKLVGDDTEKTNQAFIRRNSIRALKGMSKRLSSIAVKTGSTLPELPPEYECLHDAAMTLKFCKTARTIQYI